MRTVTNRTQKPVAISLLLICGYGLMMALVPTAVAPVGAAPHQQAAAPEALATEIESAQPNQLVFRANSTLPSLEDDRAPLQ